MSWQVSSSISLFLLMMLLTSVQAQPQYEIIQRLPSTLVRHDPVTLADGSCCIEQNPDVANCSRCIGRRVDLCFREIDHPQDDNDITNCPLGRRNRDHPGPGSGEITFQNSVSNTAYPEGFQLFYNIFQSLNGLTPLIDQGKINITLSVVDRETAGGFTEIITDGVLNLTRYSIGLKVVCTENYYGSDCSVLSFCEPQDDDTLGHYTCDSNGNIVCLNGYQNTQSNCTELILHYQIIQRLPSTLLRHDPETLADGSCCIEPNPSVANCSRCTSRRVALCFREIDHLQVDNEITNCPLGSRNRDQPGVGSGEITINGRISAIYHGKFQLFYNIYQSLNGQTPLIDEGKINITLSVVNQETAGGFTEIEHYGVLGLTTYSIGLKVVCTENYYGSDCSVFCEPQDDDTLGHYTCDSNGNIVCINGYQNTQSNCTDVQRTTEPLSVSTMVTAQPPDTTALLTTTTDSQLVTTQITTDSPTQSDTVGETTTFVTDSEPETSTLPQTTNEDTTVAPVCVSNPLSEVVLGTINGVLIIVILILVTVNVILLIKLKGRSDHVKQDQLGEELPPQDQEYEDVVIGLEMRGLTTNRREETVAEPEVSYSEVGQSTSVKSRSMDYEPLRLYDNVSAPQYTTLIKGQHSHQPEYMNIKKTKTIRTRKND